MSTSVLVLGAGFGGLELSTRLSEELGDEVDVTLIDRADAFVFGFSKLDVMFGRRTPDAVRLRYERHHDAAGPVPPGDHHLDRPRRTARRDRPRDVRGRRPGGGARRRLRPRRDARTGRGRQRVLLGAGAEGVRDVLPGFRTGTAIVGVCGAPFKCPPAPSEAALLLDEFLRERGVRDDVRIQVVMPFGTPIPPSPETSAAVLAPFAERGIEFVPDRRVAALDRGREGGRPRRRQAAALRPVPRHPGASGAAGRRRAPVSRRTAGSRSTRRRSPRASQGVYAVGDVTSVGTPKAGVFAEGAARVVADQLIARIRGASPAARLRRHGLVLHRVRRPRSRASTWTSSRPPATRPARSCRRRAETTAEKADWASSRHARWFGA